MFKYWTSVEGGQHCLDANQSHSLGDCGCVDRTAGICGQDARAACSIPVRHVALKRRSNTQHWKPRSPVDHSSQGPMPEAYGYHVVPCLTTPQSAQLCSAYSISCSPTTFSTPHMGTDQQQHPQLKTSASHDESADSNDARPTPTAPSYPRFQTLYRLAHDDSSRMLSGPAVKCAAASAAQPMPTQSGHVHISHAFIQTQSGSDPVLIPPKAPRRPQPQGPFCSNNPYMPKHSQPRQQLLDQYPHMLSMIQSASTDIHDRSVPQAVWSFPLEPRQPQAKNLSSPEQTSTLHASKPLPSIKQVLQKLEKQSATADTASSH